jgi:UDP-2,3-diacylglucosamine pyrophosphatase LpxH
MYKTIVVSDLHLGNPYSNWRVLEKFLQENSCEALFLNGDIIDEIYLSRNSKELSVEELVFFNWMIKLEYTKVIYIIGNHENFGDEFFVDTIWNKYNVKVYSDYMYFPQVPELSSTYYISHGHTTIFRNSISDNEIVLSLITASIRFIGKLQKVQKGILFKKGKNEVYEGVEFNILSKASRNFLKFGLKTVSRYRKKLRKYNKNYNANIICGHSHTSEIKSFKDFQYLNSGDWLESNTLLAQELDGEWKLVNVNENELDTIFKNSYGE